MPVFRFFALLLVAGSLAWTSGCQSAPLSLPVGFDQYARTAVEEQSLFPADQAVISNEALAQILSQPVHLPAKARVVVMRMTVPRYWGWSPELTQQDADVQARFLERLRAAPRVQRAGTLPSLLQPQRYTVPLIREAAARYQGDLVVLYRVFTRSFERQRFLAENQTRAYCMIEAVLLDTRTGLVLLATTATQTFEVSKRGRDMNFSETVWRAEVTATGQALDRVADELVSFLKDEAGAAAAG